MNLTASTIGVLMRRYILAALVFAAACAPTQSASVSSGNAGLIALSRGNNDDAIRDLTGAMDAGDLSTNDESIAQKDRGVAYYNKGEYEKAIADYDAAIRLQPDDAESYSNRANAHAALHDYDAAIADGNTAIRLKPGVAMSYNNRGLAYEGKREYDKAIADFDTAIRLDAQMGPAYNNRGIAYEAKGEYDKAIADYDAAIRIVPRFAAAHYNRGRVMFTKGNYDDAALDFQLTLNIDPKNDFAVLLLHLSQAKNGHDDAAEFRSNAAKIDLAKWPGAIVALYLGQVSSAQVMADAAQGDARAQGDQVCEADFYLAELALTGRETVQAAALLHKTLNTCRPTRMEYAVARGELQRIGK